MKKYLLATFLLLLSTNATTGQESPSLTEVQKLQLEVLTLRLENAQLKSQVIQCDFNTNKVNLTQILQLLEVPGYSLDLTSRSYIPLPKADKPMK